MKLIAQGDYYVWYCDWCDSRNHTLWTRVEKGKVVCGVCHTPFALARCTGKSSEHSHSEYGDV